MNQGMGSSLIMIVLLFVLMYFMMIRPEKKRKQQAEAMRNSLKKGDVITTIGGIVGKVVAVHDETFVIESSEDRVRIEFAKWALSANASQTAPEKGKKSKKDESVEELATEAPAAEETVVEEQSSEK